MISVTSEYALRALVELTHQTGGELLLGKTLAARAGIPPNYLSKVLWTLGNAGLVEAVRGHKGGYRLGRPAGEIFLGEVVELFEGLRSRPQCLLGRTEPCSDDNPCTAHAEYREVRQTYIDFLEKTSLAAISKPPEEKSASKRRRGKTAGNSRDGKKRRCPGVN